MHFRRTGNWGIKIIESRFFGTRSENSDYEKRALLGYVKVIFLLAGRPSSAAGPMHYDRNRADFLAFVPQAHHGNNVTLLGTGEGAKMRKHEIHHVRTHSMCSLAGL